jgi:hypothetical protein
LIDLNDNLTPLKFLPGIVKELTPRAAEPYWIDCDKVRFRRGRAELLGGWQNITTSAATADLIGQPREIETVRNLEGVGYGLVGTHVGLFSTDFSNYYNVTPVKVSALVTARFNTSAGSPSVMVSMTAHGLTNESFVSFVSVSVTIGGNVIVNPVSTERATYQVSVINANSFEFTANQTAAATSVATGGTFTVWLHYPAGLESQQTQMGWGAGPWGAGPWGVGVTGLPSPSRQWSFDFWGTDLLAVYTRGPLMIWSPNQDITVPASVISTAPSINNIVKVADSRQVFLYGTHDTLGVYDPLLIRWSDRESYTNWTPTTLNTAGEFRLTSRGSEIRSVTKVGDAHVILTAADLFLQTFVGGDDQFGFVRQSENCGVISQKAAVEFNGILYWMSNFNQFFSFNGRVESIPCDVLRFVFDNINPLYQDKIRAGVNAFYNEIWWFYPDTSSTGENNRYVIYNVLERHWSIGALDRTVWHNSRVFNRSIAAGHKGKGLFYHETGHADGSAPLKSYLKSSFFNGGKDPYILFTDKLVPDFAQADGDTPFDGNIKVTLFGRNYPNGAETVKGPFTVGPSTKKISTRLRAREFALKIESDEINKPWQMGEFSMTLKPDGHQ